MSGREAPGEIAAAMLAIMDEIGPITKARRNEHQGFSFRGIDDVYDALHPLLVKNGVLCVPNVLKVQTEEYQTGKGTVMHRTLVTVEHRFYAKDGSFIAATTLGEASDAQDKSAAKAQSVAYKYAMFETFCIPLGEPDPDANNPDGPGSARATGKRVGGPRITRVQVGELWTEAAKAAERLGCDRSAVMRVVLTEFEQTKSDKLPRALYNDILALVREPDDLLPQDGDGAPNPTNSEPAQPGA